MSYDMYTAYSGIAAMLGCISIVVLEPGKAKEDYRGSARKIRFFFIDECRKYFGVSIPTAKAEGLSMKSGTWPNVWTPIFTLQNTHRGWLIVASILYYPKAYQFTFFAACLTIFMRTSHR